MENYFIASILLTEQIGCVRAKLLLEHFGSGEAIWTAQRDELEKVNLPATIIDAFTNFRSSHPDCPEQLREYCETKSIKLCSINDENYPSILRSMLDKPALLYYKGELKANEPRIAIVGTRRPTQYGLKIAYNWGREIAGTGITVVSGAAYGIDTAAHKGAMQTGRTVAVLGEGLEVINSDKRKFLDKIIENGAVISEYSPNTHPKKGHFPRRNRIIAGLSVGVVVVEAGESSGAMNTAWHAGHYGRLLFAVPGSIHEEKSRGCHQLIREGAILSRSSKDIIMDCENNIEKEKINLNSDPEIKPIELPLLESNEALVYDIIPIDNSISTEEISIKLDTLELSDIMSVLLNLEMKDLIIERTPGNYIRS